MRYWAYVNNEILGPFEREKLLQLPSFTPSLLICPQTPVGEKTEDWKEAASYPEISAALTPDTLQSAPAVEAAAGAAGIAIQEPSSGLPSQDLKSLTPSTVETVPPKETNFGGITLEVNHLERSGRFSAAPEEVPQSAPSFDPISISAITKKAESISVTGTPSHSPEAYAATEVQPPFSAIAPEPVQAAEAPASTPPGDVPVVTGSGNFEDLSRKLETLAQNSASRQDMVNLTDPLRAKLEQMGEALAGIKNSQQREIMEKLAYLENAVSEIKASIKETVPASAKAQPAMVFETSQDVVFGAQPRAQEEKPKPAPAAKGKTSIIIDQGKKNSIIGAIIGKFFQLLFTLLLLAAILLVAAIGLRMSGVFDAAKLLPFPLPPIVDQLLPSAAAPVQAPEAVVAQAQPAANPEPPKAPDISPEIIYFVRYYKASPEGPKLEDKVIEISAAAGGSYRPDAWQAKQSGANLYEASVIVSAKQGDITFTYIVDYAKKILLPADPQSKAAFDALSKPAAVKNKKTGSRAKAGNLRKAATTRQKPPAARAQQAAAKPAAAGKASNPEDEYEYVYEDE